MNEEVGRTGYIMVQGGKARVRCNRVAIWDAVLAVVQQTGGAGQGRAARTKSYEEDEGEEEGERRRHTTTGKEDAVIQHKHQRERSELTQ